MADGYGIAVNDLLRRCAELEDRIAALTARVDQPPDRTETDKLHAAAADNAQRLGRLEATAGTAIAAAERRSEERLTAMHERYMEALEAIVKREPEGVTLTKVLRDAQGRVAATVRVEP